MVDQKDTSKSTPNVDVEAQTKSPPNQQQHTGTKPRPPTSGDEYRVADAYTDDSSILSSTESDSSDYGVLSTPFRPQQGVDLATTQTLACKRILDRPSCADTKRLQLEAQRPARTMIQRALGLARAEPKPVRARMPREHVPITRAPVRKPRRPKRSSSGSGCSSSGTTETTKMRQRNRSRRKSIKKAIKLESQAREKVYENGWTDSSIGLMEKWFEKCEEAAEDHLLAAIAARKKHVCVSLPSIVVGSAATGLAFFSVGDNDTDAGTTEATSISVALAVLTSALSVLGGLNSLFSLSTRQSLHTTAASNFQNLARKIQLTLFLPVNLRSKCDLILTDLSAEFFSIVEQSPVIYNGW